MERDADRVLELFMAAVSLAGGAGRMASEHRLGWLPSLMESAYSLVLQEEEHRPLGEIADILGTTRDAVENMLTGPADTAAVRMHGAPPLERPEREHIAGGLVRRAYSSPSLGSS
jgi:probable regulatory domain-containing protein